MQFTNKSTTTKSEQTATKHWFRNGVRRLTLALELRNSLHDLTPPPTSRIAELAHLTPFDYFVWPNARTGQIMKGKATLLKYPLAYAATSMKITLKNRQFNRNHPGRGVMKTLRAETTGKRIWVDDVRVLYDDAAGQKIGHGKCCGFFMDEADNFFVGIQWYKTIGNLNRVNQSTKMMKVELMDSFEYVPAGSIRNGAFLMPLATEPAIGHPPQFWVLQSHRETTEWF